MICPKCDKKWPDNCEQSVSIEWHDECVGCRFTNRDIGSGEGTVPELDAIAAESKRRKDPQDTTG